MPVGGVRIEDDILITSTGYENLTKAPKGDAMFDIIRGRKPTTSTAQRQGTTLPARVEDPTMFRAPGCPIQATPPGLHSIKRAATMPGPSSGSQHAEAARREHASQFRRSMTTDERIQHWHQSHGQIPPRRLTTGQAQPNTICGAFTTGMKHIFIGDNVCNVPQEQGLSQCTDCAILAQTLDRLRENLALSKKCLPTQIHMSQEVHGSTAHHITSPRAVDVGLGLRENVIKPTPMSETACTRVSQRDHHACLMKTAQEARPTEQKGARRSLHQMSLPRGTQLKQQCTAVLTTPEPLDCRDPESYYRDHEQRQDLRLQRLQAMRSTSNPFASTLRSHTSMPLEERMTQQQERRRPSNHTDDRDWMA